MRCKQCDYPLWNLPTRACPECGAAFVPSDFGFVPNAVKFCCPHCGQDYYGTGEKGHLVPSEFECVKCANPVKMDEMVLLPTAGVAESRTKAEVVPWLDRSRRFFVTKWLGTIWMALIVPARLAKALPERGGVRPAMWFAIVSCSLYMLVGWAILAIPMFFLGAGAGPGLILAFGWVIALPIGVVVVILLWSGLTHLILRVTGRATAGFSRTLVCLSYASGANVLAAIPCIGFHLTTLSWIWWGIAAAVMLTVVHRAAGWRAALAVFAPPLAVCAVAVAWVIVGMMFISAVAGSFTIYQQSVAVAGQHASVASATAGLRSYAKEHGGAAPGHALALLAEGKVAIHDLFESGIPTKPGEGLVAGREIMTVLAMGPSDQAAAIASAAKSLGANPVAHRLGDMVFTYHGIDLSEGSTAAPGLWVVIHTPPAAGTGAPTPGSGGPGAGPASSGAAADRVLIGTLGDGVKVIPIKKLTEELAAQNLLRTAAGLPPLPDPTTVRQ